jgi:hypothetical protein
VKGLCHPFPDIHRQERRFIFKREIYHAQKPRRKVGYLTLHPDILKVFILFDKHANIAGNFTNGKYLARKKRSCKHANTSIISFSSKLRV